VAFTLHGQRNRFTVNRAGTRNGAAARAALADVNPHGFNDAGLGHFDGFPQTVDAGKVLTVRVVFAAFAFDSDRIGVEIHAAILPH
jgi:hypothetical protein